MDPSVPPSRLMLTQSLQSLEDLRKLICEYGVQQSALEKREEALKYQLKELAARRVVLSNALTSAQISHEAMERSIKSLRLLLSPMRHLPNELLVRIFGIVIDTECADNHEDAGQWADSVFVFRAPILLGSVCWRWRDLLQRNGSLWRHLLLRFWDKVGEEHAILQSEERAGHWWDKSSAKVRHLFLEIYNEEHFPVLCSMLDPSLESTGTRFDSISITIATGKDLAPSVWNVGAICADEVNIFRETKTKGIDHYIPLLSSARKVLLTGMSQLEGARPWTSLTHLVLCPLAGEDRSTLAFGSKELRSLLSAAPHLERLELHFDSEDLDHREITRQNQAVVEHRSLVSICAHLTHFNPNGGFLGVELIAPTLRRLEFLGGWEHYTTESPFAIWDQPSESALPDIGKNETQFFLEVLYRLPNLAALEVGKNSGDLFQHLIGAYAPATFQAFEVPLPKLKRLWFEGSDITGVTLTSFIRSRLNLVDGCPGKPEAIETVTIFECPGISPAEWSVINDLLQEGKKLNARVTQSRMVAEV